MHVLTLCVMNIHPPLICDVSSAPQFSLESDLFEVTESNVNVSICVELKSNLKRDVGIYLAVDSGSAIGEKCSSW